MHLLIKRIFNELDSLIFRDYLGYIRLRVKLESLHQKLDNSGPFFSAMIPFDALKEIQLEIGFIKEMRTTSSYKEMPQAFSTIPVIC